MELFEKIAPSIIAGVFLVIGYIIQNRSFDRRMSAAVQEQAIAIAKKTEAETEKISAESEKVKADTTIAYKGAADISAQTIEKLFAAQAELRNANVQLQQIAGQAQADILAVTKRFDDYVVDTAKKMRDLSAENHRLKDENAMMQKELRDYKEATDKKILDLQTKNEELYAENARLKSSTTSKKPRGLTTKK